MNRTLLRLYLLLRRLFDLKDDFDEKGARESILANLDFKSGNAWSLIFAILIACVGLHVNSTAVIIGAMLISPLMGSITGAGFSLAVHDFDTMKRSIMNLSYAVGISVFTSAVFFVFAPSSGAQSELIARTQPNFYDVLIALFGGAAGIIASTRKNKSNAIPGVAIATALMPPLCTVGYGFATFNLAFSLGAFYLFLINSIFIFVSTYLFARLLNFKTVVDKNPEKDKFIHRWMSIASIVIILPSLFMVWYLHKKTNFENKAHAFIENEIASNKLIVGKPKINFSIRQSTVSVKVFGEAFSLDEVSSLQVTLHDKYEVKNTDLRISNEERDLLKESDLDQKYLSRQEFLNFQQIKLNEEIAQLKNSANEFNQNQQKGILNNKFSLNLLTDINPPTVEVSWAKKPTLLEVKKAEDVITQSLLARKFNFLHK